MEKPTVVIGAGPAGLACSLTLLGARLSKGSPLVVIDRNAAPGGLARSVSLRGHYFDIGPHRFYTKNDDIEKLWKNVLGKKFHKIRRYTRIYYDKTLFHYPLEVRDVISRIGLLDSILCFVSFVYAKLAYFGKEPKTFEDWTIKHFGRRLYEMFFKGYTEKVWGIRCSELGAVWARQRIRNLDFKELVFSALRIHAAPRAKSLVREFYYPERGAGQMFETMAGRIEKFGGNITYRSNIVRLHVRNNQIRSVEYEKGGKRFKLAVSRVFSSMPITSCLESLYPLPPKEIIESSRALRYRSHITVNLLVKGNSLFPDQWIYVHDRTVKMARIANYNNFYDKKRATGYSALSVEYFVFPTDPLWTMLDRNLIEYAAHELTDIGLLENPRVSDGSVVREADSYPMYFLGYEKHFEAVHRYLSSIRNLHLIGRGGMYKYNNMDHSMIDGIRAAKAVLYPDAGMETDSKDANEYVE